MNVSQYLKVCNILHNICYIWNVLSCLCTRESKRNFCSFVSFLVSNYPREINLFWHLSSSQLFWRQKLECIIFFLGKESRNSQQFLRITPWVLCANGPICVSFKRWFVYLFGCLFSKNLLPTFFTEQHFRTTRRMYIIDVYSPLFLIKRLFLITRSLRLKKESQNDILMIYWELIKLLIEWELSFLTSFKFFFDSTVLNIYLFQIHDRHILQRLLNNTRIQQKLI